MPLIIEVSDLVKTCPGVRVGAICLISLEGTNPIVQKIAQFLPLTHLVDGARSIMTEGAGLMDIAPHLAILALMTAVFLAIGSLIFRWE
ncbi:MAG: ABC transporter permease [Nitrospirota bacterium]